MIWDNLLYIQAVTVIVNPIYNTPLGQPHLCPCFTEELGRSLELTIQLPRSLEGRS